MEGLKPGKMLEKFLDDRRGISAMQDAVLFCVMVSIAGAILVPAFTSTIPQETHIQKEQEEKADEVLHQCLATTANVTYCMGGDQMDAVAEALSVDTTLREGLYHSMKTRFTGLEQLHKSRAALLAECLSAQFKVPMDDGNFRVNILTSEFDNILKEDLRAFFNRTLGSEYQYQFAATWHPIRGLPLGGNITVGSPVPEAADAHVSRTLITMPYLPEVQMGGAEGEEIILNENWIRNELDGWINEVPALQEINAIMQQSDTSPAMLKNSLNENLTDLLYGFLFDGISEAGFPGIINATLSLCFDKIMHVVNEEIESRIQSMMGDTLGSIGNNVLGSLTEGQNSLIHQFEGVLLSQLTTVPGIENVDMENIPRELAAYLRQHATAWIGDLVEQYVAEFTQPLVKEIQSIREESGMLTLHDITGEIADFLFGYVQITTAEVSLTIWRG